MTSKESTTVNCPACNSAAHQGQISPGDCNDCEGSGIEYVSKTLGVTKTAPCRSCNGSGKCDFCGGSGGVTKTASDGPFDGYGRPFSDDGNINMSEMYYHDNPANNVGPYSGPSSYSINTVAPYAPPHAGEENPAQNVGPYNPPSGLEGEEVEAEGEGEDLRTAYRQWNDSQWFDGTSSSIYTRVMEAERLRRQASVVGDTSLEDELVAQIDVLDKVASEFDDSSLHEFVDELPGGQVALEYDDLIEGGLVDLSSFLSVGAYQVAKETSEYDWDKFKETGARNWVSQKAKDNPGLLAHELMTREAAVDYAKTKTMVLMDPIKRADVIDEFVSSAERYRREAVEVLGEVRTAHQEAQRKTEATRMQVTAATVEDYEEGFLPGQYTELSSDYDDDGFLAIGEDDGSSLYAEARNIIDNALNRPWGTFTTEGAREWFFAKASDNPSMLKHADITFSAAKTFALGQASAVPDEAMKNEIVRAFTESVEYLREDHERREASETEHDPASEFDSIYGDEDEILW